MTCWSIKGSIGKSVAKEKKSLYTISNRISESTSIHLFFSFSGLFFHIVVDRVFLVLTSRILVPRFNVRWSKGVVHRFPLSHSHIPIAIMHNLFIALVDRHSPANIVFDDLSSVGGVRFGRKSELRKVFYERESLTFSEFGQNSSVCFLFCLCCLFHA